MASVEGIIFGDLFVNNKEFFVKFFADYYRQKEAQINPIIINLQTVLQKYKTKTVTKAMADEFKTAWKAFQRIVLLNQGDLQLLVAYRGKDGGNASFSQIIKQEDVEGVGATSRGMSYGIMAGDNLIKESMSALKASEVERFLQLHLNGFLDQLYSKIDVPTAWKIHKYHENCIANYLQNSVEHISNKRWYEAFYTLSEGHYFGGAGLGQAYDAYMNHMANKEKRIFDFLSTNGIQNSIDKINFQSQSVYIEEGKVEKTGHFAELLAASRNHIGWYTGGDIIIVDPTTMQVVYNIQLKTTTWSKPSVFQERVSAITAFLNQTFLDSTPEQKGEKIFEFFKTSISNHDEFNTAPQSTIDNLLRQNLLIKMDNIQITMS